MSIHEYITLMTLHLFTLEKFKYSSSMTPKLSNFNTFHLCTLEKFKYFSLLDLAVITKPHL